MKKLKFMHFYFEVLKFKFLYQVKKYLNKYFFTLLFDLMFQQGMFFLYFWFFVSAMKIFFLVIISAIKDFPSFSHEHFHIFMYLLQSQVSVFIFSKSVYKKGQNVTDKKFTTSSDLSNQSPGGWINLLGPLAFFFELKGVQS